MDDPGSDTSSWALIGSRFDDPLDTLAAVAPDEPFVQQLLADRQRIKRKHDEILASVPEGLSPRQREEYISARIMESIAANMATSSSHWGGLT